MNVLPAGEREDRRTKTKKKKKKIKREKRKRMILYIHFLLDEHSPITFVPR